MDKSYDMMVTNQYEEINGIWDTLVDQLDGFQGEKSYLMESFMQLLGLVRDLTEDMNSKLEGFETQFLEIGKKYKKETRDAAKYKLKYEKAVSE